MSWLEPGTFKCVVASTPLVSIDLVVRDAEDRVLLGKRNNRPAQGYWFVPGGRIKKNESLDAAFRRLTREELGLGIERSEASSLGVYEHFYADSVFGVSPDTHYVVVAHALNVTSNLLDLPRDQHSDYRWWQISELLDSKQVHDNTKAYFSAAFLPNTP